MAEPAVILADEPTGNLDTTTGEEILHLLEDLNSQGSTIVVITHDHELASQIPRQIRVRDGLIEHDSSIDGRVL